MNALARRVGDDGIEDDSEWFNSLISLLANKPVDKWLDRDKQYFLAELRLRAMQLEELERFVKNIGDDVVYSVPEPELLESKIEEILRSGSESREEMMLALMRVYNRLIREQRIEN